MATEMTDLELLVWLAEHGTDVSQEELEQQWPRVLAAVDRREDDSDDEGPAQR